MEIYVLKGEPKGLNIGERSVLMEADDEQSERKKRRRKKIKEK